MKCHRQSYTVAFWVGDCDHGALCPEQVGERPRCWGGCWINDMGPCKLRELRERTPAVA